MPNEFAAWDAHYSGPKFRFGQWLYAEAEFKRMCGVGHAMVRDGVRYIKCVRPMSGQEFWMREIVA